ncbi:MAG: [FeFe] hydrogenase H-cluster maturation GTPase HydF [Bradymonadales bacterium]|jgi:[FeFe] hydrogenase H-cluster maturation GTPase HydF
MQRTPKGLRLHIGIYGRRNVGKSSLLNALTRQDIAIVSPHKGTTTDPVQKAMELLPLGPVVFIDTAGVDDEGELGELRISRSMATMDKVDFALLVTDGEWGRGEEDVVTALEERKIPYVVVCHKADLVDYAKKPWLDALKARKITAIETAVGRQNTMDQLLQAIIKQAPASFMESEQIIGDLIPSGGLVLLVVPVDSEAPKGRLILPQVQTIRDILDNRALCMVCKESELAAALDRLKSPPQLVVTDSQAFESVSAMVPDEIPLTSFSILFARFKADLATLVLGAQAIAKLKQGDKILIAESCTHHPGHDDIGRVKIPRWLSTLTQAELEFDAVQGPTMPEDLSQYALIIHCGGCMFNRRMMLARLSAATSQGVPITNYGLAIAYIHGIFKRALRIFPQTLAALEAAEAQ